MLHTAVGRAVGEALGEGVGPLLPPLLLPPLLLPPPPPSADAPLATQLEPLAVCTLLKPYRRKFMVVWPTSDISYVQTACRS